jgi:hypothetical protein
VFPLEDLHLELPPPPVEFGDIGILCSNECAGNAPSVSDATLTRSRARSSAVRAADS